MGLGAGGLGSGSIGGEAIRGPLVVDSEGRAPVTQEEGQWMWAGVQLVIIRGLCPCS